MERCLLQINEIRTKFIIRLTYISRCNISHFDIHQNSISLASPLPVSSSLEKKRSEKEKEKKAIPSLIRLPRELSSANKIIIIVLFAFYIG